MKILLVTDAWQPQVNGVVTTLVELVRHVQQAGHEVVVIHPAQFRTWPCPGYAGIDLALIPGRRLRKMIDEARPDAIHIATEGPLGWAARRHCLRRGLAFTTAYHTRFPEMLNVALGVPLSWGYALFRRFHRPSQGVMVPSSGVMALLKQRGFSQLREWTHGVDTSLFEFLPQPRDCVGLGELPRPVSLFVGRLSHEKNIQAFLDLDIPGSKVVCGVGPLEVVLRERYPDVHWVGVLPRRELAEVYAAADVFVFPSLHETFGLVMLEAMASGVPVAAFPVDGPLQVVGNSGAGVLHGDLRLAWSEALQIPRQVARERALSFGWERAAELFLTQLSVLPARRRTGRTRPLGLEDESAVLALQRLPVSQDRHRLVE